MQNEINAAANKIYGQIQDSSVAWEVQEIIKKELGKPAFNATIEEIKSVIEMAVNGGFKEAEILLGA